MKNLIIGAVEHKGFSFIEVLQPCPSFFNTLQFYNEKVYEAANPELESREKALTLIREWNYNGEGKIPLGVMYKKDRPLYEEEMKKHLNGNKPEIEKCLQTHL